MADAQFSALTAQDRLENTPFALPEAEISVVSDVEFLAINFAINDEQLLAKKLGQLPQAGKSTKFKQSHLLWTENGQVFCVSEDKRHGEVNLATLLGDAGHVTDISDGWVALRISGARGQVLMDQLVMPDLSPKSFPLGDVTSTVFAHLRIVIWRNRAEQITLMSAASSAVSFWHALSGELQTAARNQDFNHA